MFQAEGVGVGGTAGGDEQVGAGDLAAVAGVALGVAEEVARALLSTRTEEVTNDE